VRRSMAASGGRISLVPARSFCRDRLIPTKPLLPLAVQRSAVAALGGWEPPGRTVYTRPPRHTNGTDPSWSRGVTADTAPGHSRQVCATRAPHDRGQATAGRLVNGLPDHRTQTVDAPDSEALSGRPTREQSRNYSAMALKTTSREKTAARVCPRHVKADPRAAVVSSSHRNARAVEDLGGSLPSQGLSGSVVELLDDLE
jgi:hypothetical protein